MPLRQPPALLQTAFTEIVSDTTTVSASFVDLLTLTISTDQGSTVEMHFTISASNSAAGADLQCQILIDGVAQLATHLRTIDATGAQSAGIRFKSAVLAVGSHTFKAQWLTSTGTARVRPHTTVIEHASLLVKEMTV